MEADGGGREAPAGQSGRVGFSFNDVEAFATYSTMAASSSGGRKGQDVFKENNRKPIV